MALLDFIRNRGGQEQATADQPKPETAKEMYRREASQENPKPVQSLTPDQQAKVAQARELFQQGTERAANAPSVNAEAPAGGATSPQPMRQMAMNQDKESPALSPTSAQAGTPSSERQVQAPEKSQQQVTRTMARTTPSWER